MRCRVDCDRINAGVVALGESPADRSREVLLIPNYIRVKATTKCYCSKRKRVVSYYSEYPSHP